ncbi:hypothetical protein [Streptacidiphilus cavernicola]|uniref:Uncharacterized protein n=1 Tax=Streptacidiphilus cavernicola TaxID=3342716 RepID=A0ABV6VTG0_9ACTN
MNRPGLSRRRLMTTGAGAALAATAVGAAAGPAAADTAPAADPYVAKLPHQIEAEQIVDYLLNTAPGDLLNQYKSIPAFDGQSTVVTWGTPGNPASYRVLAQCASFQTLVLERAYGAGTGYGWATPAYFKDNFFPASTDTSKRYPDAAEFRTGFADAAAILNLTAVTKPVNLRPGDLVAIDYNNPNGTYSGHIVMIRKRKAAFASGVDAQVGAGAVPYVFEVVDCTDTPHGEPKNPPTGSLADYQAYPDTRYVYTDPDVDLQTNTGVGYGHMVFYADPVTKLFAGHRWSVNDASPLTVAQQPIAAARVYLGQLG